jgi:hypothetical protein
MNSLVLTKISKFTLIGTTTAFINFVGKFQPEFKLFFVYLYCGTILILIFAVLWEGRESLAGESDAEKITDLLAPITSGKSKRQYLLAPSTRLEIIIGLVVITISALIGGL